MEVIVLLLIAALVVRQAARRSTAEPRPELGPQGWVDGINWGVVRPLARVEVRRLLRHPAFLSGVVLSPLIFALATSTSNEVDSWVRASPAIALGLVPFGWLVIVAAHLLTSRPARTGTDTLFATLPAPQPVRTAGLLATAIGSFGVAALLAAGWVVYLQSSARVLTGSPQWLEIAVGLLIAAGSVTVGVAVARFFPHPAFGIVGAVACGFIQARFFEVGSWPWNLTEASPFRFLGFLASPTSVDAALEIRPAAWHLVYLVGLVAFMGCVALARNGVPRALAVVTSAAVATTAMAGWAQTRPPTEARIVAMIDYIQEPRSRQVCERVRSVRYCAFNEDRGLLPAWRSTVESVLRLTPDSVAGRSLDVTGRVPTIVGNASCGQQPYTDGLVPDVAARLDPDKVWRADGQIHPGTDQFPCGGRSVDGLFLAVQTGAWAVGLPPAPHGRDVRCVADRQARSVIALWLGMAATPGGPRNLGQIVREEPTTHLRFADWNNPPMWGVRFAKADAAMARAMLKVPTPQVARVVADHWTTLVDPATPASALASLVGIGAAGTVPPLPGAPACA